MTRLLGFLIVVFCLLAWERPLLAVEPPRPVRRIAVLVGANEPAPGRQSLRYAHSDAQLMADVLERVGRFTKADIHVLLEPRPHEVLAALDNAARDLRAAGPESLLVFYYSGHSDGQQVFPHGDALALSDLRDRIARSSARVRIAILDTCRGGGWTQTKGLSVGPPLDVADLMSVSTEGMALLASSSGLENAHEAAAVKGSFFTHHVAAGLLGAADRSGDGNVTLQEVFEYAKERTVRDSARMAATAQHPSFDTQLRGRQDLVLAQIATSPSALEVTQQNALEIIHLASGVTVAETPQGSRQLRLALVPGRYLVRRVVDGRVYSREIEVRPGATVFVDEAQLQVTGSEKLALKDGTMEPVPYSNHSTMPRKWGEIRFGLGSSTGRSRFGMVPWGVDRSDGVERQLTTIFSATYGITDRLSWTLLAPAFTYRFGREGSFEVLPRGGMPSFGWGRFSGWQGTVDAGVATRAWLTPRLSLLTNISASWSFQTERTELLSDTLFLRATGGMVWNLGEHVTLAAGLGVSGDLVLRRAAVGSDPNLISPSFVLGSVQALGYRPLPLIQVHLSRRFSLDGYLSLGFELRDAARVRDSYLGGFTWTL